MTHPSSEVASSASEDGFLNSSCTSSSGCSITGTGASPGARKDGGVSLLHCKIVRTAPLMSFCSCRRRRHFSCFFLTFTLLPSHLLVQQKASTWLICQMACWSFFSHCVSLSHTLIHTHTHTPDTCTRMHSFIHAHTCTYEHTLTRTSNCLSVSESMSGSMSVCVSLSEFRFLH